MLQFCNEYCIGVKNHLSVKNSFEGVKKEEKNEGKEEREV